MKECLMYINIDKECLKDINDGNPKQILKSKIINELLNYLKNELIIIKRVSIILEDTIMITDSKYQYKTYITKVHIVYDTINLKIENMLSSNLNHFYDHNSQMINDEITNITNKFINGGV